MTQETHEALKLADEAEFVPLSSATEWVAMESVKVARLIRQQHALIVQMAHVFEGEHFEHDDQRKAIADCTQYLKAKP